MASTLEELRAHISEAVEPGYRQSLLARGQARAMIWREGQLPEDAPNYSPELSDGLLSFGYSLVLHGLRFIDIGGETDLARKAFEVAAEALEAVVANGERTVERDFHRLIAAASYHLGRFSARSYSLLHKANAESNLSTVEWCLAKLMLRDIDGLDADIKIWFGTGKSDDQTLIGALDSISEEDDEGNLEVVLLALEGNFMAAMSQCLMALERGDPASLQRAIERLRNGLDVAGQESLVSQWWVHRLTIHIISGLWDSSFHALLPSTGPTENWKRLRNIFIASLFKREKAEIELWPSQIQAATRVLDFDANLVLSLPTSAGKTRIAELCILACLSRQKRVVFVTPLRALSAQTEVSLRRTFGPLGMTISSLYGSIGAGGADFDVLRSSNVVVATPEKLDFALRNSPELLDDVGLVVLDEGHMIGLGEREVRYEAQIQRLLRRDDAATRRILCLSAILPDGEQLEDFSAWLTMDRPDGLIKNDWRPTRLRFGMVQWNTQDKSAMLRITVGDETPFVPKFIVGKKPTQKGKSKIFPSDQTELCIATAWRLMDDGQTVLVFCPIRRSVLPFARRIIEMHSRGHIRGVLQAPMSKLASALAVGGEWFGENHEILQCLRLGVAVHHGELPTPYRKEIERLLRDGILRITVSSPTLAQGLNLAATSLVFHGAKRNGELLEISEFRNVVGRAGRAYVDVEGLVVYPMFNEHVKKEADWRQLVDSQSSREMESGLVRLVLTLMLRMNKLLGSPSNIERLIEYVSGQGAWDFPILPREKQRIQDDERASWEGHLTSLDTAIFSLLGDAQVADDKVAAKIDEVLTSSLFQRRLARKNVSTQRALTEGLKARANYIWRNTSAIQRRAYFLAGIGLKAGKVLDDLAPELERHLLAANLAIYQRDEEGAVDSITAFARIAFTIAPFIPAKLTSNWEEVLKKWLLGQPIIGNCTSDEDDENTEDSSDQDMWLIEHAFVYNLPWAMEAIRVRASVHEDIFSDETKLSDFDRAHAVSALETGTLNVAAMMLIKSGFASRLGAIVAVESTAAEFESSRGMRDWLKTPEITATAWNPDWPTPESHNLWMDFVSSDAVNSTEPWESKTYKSLVSWFNAPPPPGRPLIIGARGKERTIYAEDYVAIGKISWQPDKDLKGLMLARATGEPDSFEFEYIGPDNPPWS